jgi:hypothetical protein
MLTLSAHFDGRFIALDEPASQKIWDNPFDADYNRL